MVAQHIFKTAGVAALILALYLHLKNLGIMKKKTPQQQKQQTVTNREKIEKTENSGFCSNYLMQNIHQYHVK